MAAWRRAIELSLAEADLERLKAIAQSRTEPASRVERARIVLGYWKETKPKDGYRRTGSNGLDQA